ncbi:MAG: DMT family transporter [Clostridia bacterium]
MKRKNTAALFAIAAAALYAVNIPLSKILLQYAAPTMMAAFLYLGAGIGLLICDLFTRKKKKEEPLTRKELPYTVAMVLLDIAAPILLMYGITRTCAANVSLLNNLEIAATALIAFILFKETISRQLRIAIILVILSGIFLSFEGKESFQFNYGSLFVLAATICWGFENNCTRVLSSKSPTEIVIIKGCFSGLGSLIIALILREPFPTPLYILLILLLGFVSYGLSIHSYIKAQKDLGAAKTGAWYAIAPFLGVAFSLILLHEKPTLQFFIALAIMAAATVFIIKDTVTLQHSHGHQHRHCHTHTHGNVVHCHEHIHEHTHLHTHENTENNHKHPHNELKDHHHSHENLSTIFQSDSVI